MFPGIQGGPLEHIIAAKAVAFGEALQPEFKTYIDQVVVNAQAMGEAMVERGLRLVSRRHRQPPVLVDLHAGRHHRQGRRERCSKSVGITVNKNAIPFDPLIARSSRAASASARRPSPRGASTRPTRDTVGASSAQTIFNRDDERDARDGARRGAPALVEAHPLYPEL